MSRNFISHATIVVLSILAILLMLNTQLFIYKFLSDAYCLHLAAIALLLLNVFSVVASKENSPLKIAPLLIIYCLYLLINLVLTDKSEAYYLTYLLICLLIIFALTQLIRNGNLTTRNLLIPIVIAGCYEGVIVTLQLIGILSPESELFKATGTFENPNATAMILCLTFPALYHFFINGTKKQKTGIVIIAGWSLALIILLQCRTALVGVIVIILMAVFSTDILKKTNFKHKVVILTIIIIAITSTMILHEKKQVSADSRIRIWTHTIELIKKNALSGVGYGLFEKAYNLQQADYFMSANRVVQEKMNAAHTGMAYNDYLEQTAMGGIPGGAIYFLVILSLLPAAWGIRKNTVVPLLAIASFTVMSFLNFGLQIPLLLFFLAIYISIILAHTNFLTITVTLSKKIFLISSACLLVLVLISLNKYNAQKELLQARNFLKSGETHKALAILDEIAGTVSTSEAYYRTKAMYYYQTGKYPEALKCNQVALRYSSSYLLYIETATLADRSNDYASAANYYRIAAGIEPHAYKPMALEMKMYLKAGNTANAKKIAQAIIALPPKIQSVEVNEYKQLAQHVINN